jgi:spermidine synthase
VLNLFALFLAATSVFGFWGAEPLARTRTFFGTLKVVRTVDGQYVQLIHGTTLHGAQPSDPARRNEPVTYYARSGPLGQIFDLLHRPGARPPRKVAVVGLGTGSTIAYARPGEDWVFYELDPGILALAQNEKYFTYLRGRDASSTHFVIGDARLRLAEAPDAAYDLIVMDAFTSDAIPAHLLTHEALELYWKKLSPGGWLAFNVSNRYLDLSRLLAALAEATGAVAEMRSDLKVPEGPESHGVSASVWVVLSRDSTLPRLLQGDSRWTRPQRGSMRLWTDDYSNLLSVLR